jgi:hypothetical protein
MEKLIFEFRDSNMARQEWRWVFSLKRCADGTFTLSGEQIPVEPEESDEPFLIAPVSSLQRGTDIYEEFQVMLSEAGGDIHNEDLDAIADEIVEFDPKVAHHFLNGEGLLHRHACWQQRKLKREHDKALAPFRKRIDDYCATVDDRRPSRRPSERTRVRGFLEKYVIEHRKIPTGSHTWRMSNGWGDGSRDFSDFPDE